MKMNSPNSKVINIGIYGTPFHHVISLPLYFPKVNVLSQDFSTELVDVMTEAFNNLEAKSIVLISSKPGCFIAGADIGMLDAAANEEEVCLGRGLVTLCGSNSLSSCTSVTKLLVKNRVYPLFPNL